MMYGLRPLPGRLHGVGMASEVARPGSPRRILCVHQGHELYGSDRSFLSSLEVLRDRYPEAAIDVVVPRRGELTDRLKGLHGVHVIVEELAAVRAADAGRPVSAAVRVLTRVPAAVKRAASYEALYVNTVVVADYLLASRFVRGRTIVHVREIPASRSAALAFSGLLWLARATCVYNSAATRDAYLGKARRAGVVVHNGVETVSASPVDAAGPGPLRLLLIGRINTWKGHDLLLDALRRLSEDERERFSVRIVGDVAEGQGALRTALARRLDDEGLHGTVTLHPFTPDPSNEYRLAHVVVVPSTRPEPFGRVAVEAMSAGRPVLAADHGGLREIVEDGVSGWRFPAGDVGALTDRLRSLERNRHVIAATGGRAQARFEKEFSLEAYRRRLGEVFADAFG